MLKETLISINCKPKISTPLDEVFKHYCGDFKNNENQEKLFNQFKENFNIDISSILKRFIRFQRFPIKKCRDTPVSKNANKSAPSSIIIILKRPIHEIPTRADIFLK